MESPSLQEQRKRVAEDAIDTVLASVERVIFRMALGSAVAFFMR